MGPVIRADAVEDCDVVRVIPRALGHPSHGRRRYRHAGQEGQRGRQRPKPRADRSGTPQRSAAVARVSPMVSTAAAQMARGPPLISRPGDRPADPADGLDAHPRTGWRALRRATGTYAARLRAHPRPGPSPAGWPSTGATAMSRLRPCAPMGRQRTRTSGAEGAPRAGGLRRRSPPLLPDRRPVRGKAVPGTLLVYPAQAAPAQARSGDNSPCRSR
jgi:hypothetical protein